MFDPPCKKYYHHITNTAWPALTDLFTVQHVFTALSSSTRLQSGDQSGVSWNGSKSMPSIQTAHLGCRPRGPRQSSAFGVQTLFHTHTRTHSHTSPLNTHQLVRRHTFVNKEASNDVYPFTVQWVHMVFRVNGLTKCSFAFACKYLYLCEKRLSTASTADFSSVVIKGSWQRGVGGRGMSNVGTNTLL